MKRLIYNDLVHWKLSYRRKPLIIRGARQVGKTWIIRYFGEKDFQNHVQVDFEYDSRLKSIFKPDLNPKRICSDLEIATGHSIIPGKTLLFFDEIQECPEAIASLRYFYEAYPEMHVVAAGSLLEFALGESSFPVGRVQFLEVHPLTFIEFQMALGNDKIAKMLAEPVKKLSPALHDMLLSELKKYFFTGGMPEVVKTFIEKQSLKEAIEVQSEICKALKDDFAKYNPQVDKNCLSNVFTGLAKNIGRQTKYTSLEKDFSNPTIKKAYMALERARLIHKISEVSPAGIPLQVMSSRIFKTCMLDIGLMNYLCGIYQTSDFLSTDLLSIYRGAMAEQFVGQELAFIQKSGLFYWDRQAKSSTAEVDFVITKKDKIIPIEVKSAKSGSLRSMHLFLDEYRNCDTGYVFSTNQYNELPDQKLTFIPLYFVYSACV